jgi:hypothetical protein
MRITIKTMVYAMALAIAMQVSAQDSLTQEDIFPSGISLGIGIGSYAVKDAYISGERYTGSIPYYSIGWMHFKSKGGYRLQFEYWKTNNISNNNISADVQQFCFNQDFILPIGSFSLFNKPVYAYLGPSVQVFYYEIYFKFATPGTFISPITTGGMGSLGINGELIYNINNKFQFDAYLRSNLLSFTGKRMDEREHKNESNPTLLTLISANKLDFGISTSYCPISWFALSLGYRFDLSRINKWEAYIAASNNVIVSIKFIF